MTTKTSSNFIQYANPFSDKHAFQDLKNFIDTKKGVRKAGAILASTGIVLTSLIVGVLSFGFGGVCSFRKMVESYTFKPIKRKTKNIPPKFKPKVVLITGSSSGIGLATAEFLAKKGYQVYATCRSPDKASELQNLKQKYNKNISIVKLDVTSEASVEEAVKKIQKKAKTIDAVINNAGITIFGPSETCTAEEMNKIFDTNVTGVKRVNDAVVPIMRKNKSGIIINMGSESAIKPSAALPIYSACKAALQSLTATDNTRLAKWNIHVTLLQPPHIKSKLDVNAPNGTRFKDTDNPYTNLDKERKSWEKRMSNGGGPLEVAEKIHKIIQSPKKPDLWSQSSAKVTNNVKKYYRDPTGNTQKPAVLLK